MAGGVEITDLGIGTGAAMVGSYGGGGFVIGGESYSGSVMIIGGEVRLWGCADFARVGVGDFAGVEGSGVDLFFLGCGERMVVPSREVRDWFAGCGIALDFMGTGSACRSYNVAVGEGRNVGGGFIAI